MLRFYPEKKVLEIGVHDLIDAGPPKGDLRLQVAWRAQTRMREGQKVHRAYQDQKRLDDPNFEAEATIKYTLVCRKWEVRISGRIDGLIQLHDRVVVEEIKSISMVESDLANLKLPEATARALYAFFTCTGERGRRSSCCDLCTRPKPQVF